MEGLGNFIKWLSIIFVTIIIIIVTSVYFQNKHSEESYIKKINDYENQIDILENNIAEYHKLYDSLIINYNKDIDSLNDIKQKTITIYEKQEVDFSNNAIVDDDSIIRFIATKIQD